jgi:hypothetical protein
MSRQTGGDKALQDAVQTQLRRSWRRGRTFMPQVLLYNATAHASPSYIHFDRFTGAADQLIERGVLVWRSPKYHLTPTAQVVYTLFDEVLDRILSADGYTTDDNAPLVLHNVSVALTTTLDQAMRRNATRTVEYLLRARHGVDRDTAVALAHDITVEHLLRPAAKLLAEGPAFPPAEADSLVRAILSLPDTSTARTHP